MYKYLPNCGLGGYINGVILFVITKNLLSFLIFALRRAGVV